MAVAEESRGAARLFGNPYLLGQFPSVGTYLTAYGVSDDLERAVLCGRDVELDGPVPVTCVGRDAARQRLFLAIDRLLDRAPVAHWHTEGLGHVPVEHPERPCPAGRSE